MTTSTIDAPEQRLTASQLRLVDVDADKRLSTIEGRAVPYDEWTTISWFRESMASGVFDKSLSMRQGVTASSRGLPLLLWHDNRSWPIGVSAEWRSADGGLDGVWRLDESPEAQRAGRMARDGMLTGMSVGFMPKRDKWDWSNVPDDWFGDELDEDALPRCIQLEARLCEVSIVPAGAYESAQVRLVRTAAVNPRHRSPTPRLDYWRKTVEELR